MTPIPPAALRPTAPAARWLARMAAAHPGDVDRWRRWGEILARDEGAARLQLHHLEAAFYCAGEEFLPSPPA